MNSPDCCDTKCPPLAQSPVCSPSPSDTLGQTPYIGAARIRQIFSPSVGFRGDATWLTLGLQTLGSWGAMMVGPAGQCPLLPVSFSEQPVHRGPCWCAMLCDRGFLHPTSVRIVDCSGTTAAAHFQRELKKTKSYMYYWYSSLISSYKVEIKMIFSVTVISLRLAMIDFLLPYCLLIRHLNTEMVFVFTSLFKSASPAKDSLGTTSAPQLVISALAPR